MRATKRPTAIGVQPKPRQRPFRGGDQPLVFRDPLRFAVYPVTPSSISREFGGAGAPGLEWRDYEPPFSGPSKSSEPTDGCLAAFMRLADHRKSDHDIARFAKRWGPLGIGSNGLPAAHLRDKPLLRVERPSSTPGRPTEMIPWEPAAVWRAYARQFRAVVELAKQHREPGFLSTAEEELFHRWAAGELVGDRRGWPRTLPNDSDVEPRESAWAVLERPAPTSFFPDIGTRRPVGFAERIAAERDEDFPPGLEEFTFAAGIDDLIEVATLRPRYTYLDSGEYWLELAPAGARLRTTRSWNDECGPYWWPENSVFPVLVCQLLAAVTTPEGQYRCDECGQLHARKRAPRANAPCYCPNCARVMHLENDKIGHRNKRAAEREARALQSRASVADES